MGYAWGSELSPFMTEEDVVQSINMPTRKWLKCINASVKLFPEFNTGEDAKLNSCIYNHETKAGSNTLKAIIDASQSCWAGIATADQPSHFVFYFFFQLG